MPQIGLLLGKVDFSNLFITISGEKYAALAQVQDAGSITLNIDVLFNTIIDFLIVALAIFFLVRQMNKLEKKDKKPGEVTSITCPHCLMEISVKSTRYAACTSNLK